MDVVFQIIVGIVIAAASSLITVRLSRHQFRSERWWEKKVVAYERVIDAFHHSRKFSSEHFQAALKSRELPKEREEELRKLAGQANDEIKRASDVGSFLLSDEALKVLARYEAEVEKLDNCESWYAYLAADLTVTGKYMQEFLVESQRDLKR